MRLWNILRLRLRALRRLGLRLEAALDALALLDRDAVCPHQFRVPLLELAV